MGQGQDFIGTYRSHRLKDQSDGGLNELKKNGWPLRYYNGK